MARPFEIDEAQTLISNLRSAQEKLSHIASSEAFNREQVQSASQAMVTHKAYRILSGISIDELNREKRGIRVSALRAAGYNTIADISTADPYNLSTIHGISADTAYTIHSIVQKMCINARQGIKIKLSADNRTSDATALVTALSRYRHSQIGAKTCSQLLAK